MKQSNGYSTSALRFRAAKQLFEQLAQKKKIQDVQIISNLANVVVA